MEHAADKNEQSNKNPATAGHFTGASGRLVQYATFLISGHLYGVPVMRVREVVKPLQITEIPLASPFVHGLINLRGQVVTAIGVHKLFGIPSPVASHLMNVICETQQSLISLQADEIGDVIELEADQMEPPPGTTGESVRGLLQGVYKMKDRIFSVIDIDLVCKRINEAGRQPGRQQGVSQ